MNRSISNRILTAASLLVAAPALAQTLDCTCSSVYEVGDRVVALVSNPNGSSIAAGTLGTVVCGRDLAPPEAEILVRWDGYTDGSSGNITLCSCPGDLGSGTNADWLVGCSQIALWADECADAIDVGLGTTTFDATDATGIAASQCVNFDHSDFWFSFTDDGCAGTYTFNTEGSSYNTTLTIYDGCGGAELDCNDDIDGSIVQSEVTMFLDPGQTVAIRVAAAQGFSPGPGQLTVSLIEPVDSDGDGVADCEDECPDVPNVTNTTQGTIHGTIADAVAASNRGDVLELAACTFYERDIVLSNRDVTIRGQGPDLTIVDGENVAGAIFASIRGDESTFEGLTLRNGFEPVGNGGGAVNVRDESTSVSFLNCRFESNDGGTRVAGAVYVELATAVFESCVFSDSTSTAGSHIVAFGEAFVTGIQCLFVDGAGSQTAILMQNVNSSVHGRFVNCTFAGFSGQRHIRIIGPGSTGEIIGCVFEDGTSVGAFAGTNGATIITNARNVYAGATGDNIPGVPTFVDAPNGDYRLAPGSLGIDAADAGAFVATGGGLLDLAGQDRATNDSGTPDTGVGPFAYLDCGAYEFQGVASDPTGACCLGGGHCVVAAEADCLTSSGTYQGNGTDCAGVVCDGCAGDLDGDGDTDVFDFNIFAPDFGCETD